MATGQSNASQTRAKAAASPLIKAPSRKAPSRKGNTSDAASKIARAAVGSTKSTSPKASPDILNPTIGTGKSARATGPARATPGDTLQDLVKASQVADENPARRMSIDPALAQMFLSRNKSNRSLSVGHAQKLAQAMLDGHWIENGDTLKFDTDGELIDGQHRLLAITIAGIAMVFDVKFNIRREAQATIDTGRRRTVADQLHINGEPYSKALAGTVSWVHRISFNDTGYRVTTPEAIDFLNRNGSVRESVAFVHSNKSIKGTISTLLASVHFIASQALNTKASADGFVEVFRLGIPAYPGDPAHKLREDNLALVLSRAMRTDRAHMDNLLYVWNLHRNHMAPRAWKPKASVPIEGFDPRSFGINPDRQAATLKIPSKEPAASI